jgi:hypothetical protein
VTATPLLVEPACRAEKRQLDRISTIGFCFLVPRCLVWLPYCTGRTVREGQELWRRQGAQPRGSLKPCRFFG